MSEIRVLIVEDEPLIAEDISDYLRSINYNPVGIAYSSEEAFDMLTNRQPDIAILDINIDGAKDGIEVAELIRTKHKIPYIFLTSHSDKSTLDRAKMTLPYGYIVKPFTEKDLLSSIEMALFRHAQENKSPLPPIDTINNHLAAALTEKEYVCLQQIFDGATNKQMAEKQFVSINTIKTHLKNLFTKLDVPNRTTAVQRVISMPS